MASGGSRSAAPLMGAALVGIILGGGAALWMLGGVDSLRSADPLDGDAVPPALAACALPPDPLPDSAQKTTGVHQPMRFFYREPDRDGAIATVRTFAAAGRWTDANHRSADSVSDAELLTHDFRGPRGQRINFGWDDQHRLTVVCRT